MSTLTCSDGGIVLERPGIEVFPFFFGLDLNTTLQLWFVLDIDLTAVTSCCVNLKVATPSTAGRVVLAANRSRRLLTAPPFKLVFLYKVLKNSASQREELCVKASSVPMS